MISTASLELGIDMGDVDLVCQVESPGNVARGLQRVGRAGHVVHGVSKGRLIAKTPADLLETAALARAMLQGQIEPLRVPHGCLDVLAQQVVACVAMDRWNVPELFDLVRGAYPFVDLPAEAFERVLCLVSGRYPDDLAPRPAGPDRLGPDSQSPGGAAGLGSAGPGRRRNDSRHRPVSRFPGRGRPAAGRA